MALVLLQVLPFVPCSGANYNGCGAAVLQFVSCTVGLEREEYQAVEGERVVEVCIVMGGGSNQAVNVSMTTRNGTAQGMLGSHWRSIAGAL